MNPWIQTYTGLQAWPLDLKPGQVCIEDIAHALANLCRYTGHCSTFYSVAEHSVHVSLYVPYPDALSALLHDASEAYLGDCSAPLKQRSYFALPFTYEMVPFKEIEKRCHGAICSSLGVGGEVPTSVKTADLRMLMTEKEQLLGESPAPWQIDAKPYEFVKLKCLPPREAERRFLERYVELIKGN